MAGLVYLKALDATVALTIEGSRADELDEAVRHSWSRCLRVAPEGAELPLTATLGDDDDLLRVMDQLSPRVTMAAIDHHAGLLYMLHAAALADTESGRVVALVAPSGTGKTTASRELGARFGYLTDETVGVRADGSIAPYPKPLSVITEASSYKAQLSIDELDLAVPPEVCRLHRVLMLERDGSAEPWVEAVPTVRALAMIAPETSYLGRLPSPLRHVAELLGTRGGLGVVHYAEAADLADVVNASMEVVWCS